ncbi:MAG TPA: LuxR C-terminal-related transcriptional regulator, partial [Myxococcaceae bacterium]
SVQAMKAGAIDFLEKPVDDGALLDAVIRAVARGRSWREARAMREEASNLLATLTPREREVFSLVALGKPNKRIAAELGTTEKTIKVHRGRVMAKLGADSVVDLVRLSQKADQLAG